MTARCPDLPFLPGYTFNPNIGRTKFNKDNFFDNIAPGVRGMIEKVRPNILGPLTDRYPSLYARGEAMEIPGWLAFDKQILQFDGFFKEALQEVRGAANTVRKVKIFFFLEDGTIQVTEPRVDNSGMTQGTLISRQRIRFPAPMDANFYDVLDINVGREIELYGRVFKVINCDRFTRNFLNRAGIPVPDPIVPPDDPYLINRARDVAAFLPKKPRKKVDTLGKFLKNDRKVLRFYGYWDDQETMYGYLHKLELHYYLADDTIDIKENIIDQAGVNSGFQFLVRGKLPKVYKGLPGPGAHSNYTVLNVLGQNINDAKYMTDSLDCGSEAVDCYGEQDLIIGGIVNVYGRRVVLTECDAFTKEYYRVKYGIDDFTPAPTPEDTQEIPCNETVERELPPWNGYGTFEDSAQNCISVEPKAPHRDFKKFLKFDKVGLDSHNLRFEARMISKIPENCTRTFIITLYLSDDTVSVFEIAARNTGFKTEAFFKRESVVLPGQPVFTSVPPETYGPEHFFVGATLMINDFTFVLIGADEYAYRYMELECNQFKKSNIKLIMDKVREVLRPTYRDFVDKYKPSVTPVITYEELRNMLCPIMGKDFTEQEMITIARHFSAPNNKPRFERNYIRQITLTELKRYLWDDLDRLKEYLLKFDIDGKGVLPKKEVYTVLRACRLPLDQELLDKIFQVLKKDKDCNIIYEDVLEFFDRCRNPLADSIPINVKYYLSDTADIPAKAGRYIDWCAFNKYLNLEKTFEEVIGEPVENVQPSH